MIDEDGSPSSKSSPRRTKLKYDRSFLLQFQDCTSTPVPMDSYNKLLNLDARKVQSASPRSFSPRQSTSLSPMKSDQAYWSPPRNRASSPFTSHSGGEFRFDSPCHRKHKCSIDYSPSSRKSSQDFTVNSISSDFRQFDSFMELPNKAETPYQCRPRASSDLLRLTQGLLNKLTPEKYDELSARFIDALFDSPLWADRLQDVVSLIFEKALSEQQFSNIYANLCKDVATAELNHIQTSDKTKSKFRRLLLAKCQSEFETRSETTPTEESDLNKRIRKTGNIKFVGELFKNDILTEKIIRVVIHNLLFQNTEPSYEPPAEDLEVLSKLLTTVGKLIDVPANQDWVTLSFDRICYLCQSPNYSTRHNFMLMNLIDLRQHNWIPRTTELEAVKLVDLDRKIEQMSFWGRMELESSFNSFSASCADSPRTSSVSSLPNNFNSPPKANPNRSCSPPLSPKSGTTTQQAPQHKRRVKKPRQKSTDLPGAIRALVSEFAQERKLETAVRHSLREMVALAEDHQLTAPQLHTRITEELVDQCCQTAQQDRRHGIISFLVCIRKAALKGEKVVDTSSFQAGFTHVWATALLTGQSEDTPKFWERFATVLTTVFPPATAYEAINLVAYRAWCVAFEEQADPLEDVDRQVCVRQYFEVWAMLLPAVADPPFFRALTQWTLHTHCTQEHLTEVVNCVRTANIAPDSMLTEWQASVAPN
eukprot:NODE_388_length_2308_cov_94.401651_g359_i0.p1 GENE.NODE_388_length_2308_cov_94.401651_g359_i0~~NODE_388_length_2308_cov_94.401651_g359_i0.p1  ORF type:complete len:706 (+),score=176.61 NODE_388_length_2308_cov_94.401651_g359_i0:58-2175(+)